MPALGTIAACLALALAPASVLAQSAPPPGQTRADQAIDGRLSHVANALRESAERLADPAPADWHSARSAVDGAQAMLSELPADPSQEATLAQARTALAEAHEALEAPAPDRGRVTARLRDAAGAIAALRPGLGAVTPQRR